MKYLILIFLIFLFGCSGETFGERQAAIDMLKKMKPLNAAEQSLAIKECEKNDGWTGMPVTFKEVTIQIRCVPK